MVKLQQFYVIKIHSDLLRFKNYTLNYEDLNELRRKKWLVSLADSQVLRTIRRIRYNRTTQSNEFQYDCNESFSIQKQKYQAFKNYLKQEQFDIQELKKYRKKLSRQEYSEKNRLEI